MSYTSLPVYQNIAEIHSRLFTVLVHVSQRASTIAS